VFDIAPIIETLAERHHEMCVGFGGPGVEKPNHRHRRLLRARCERPRSRCAAQCEYEFSPSDVDCHATLQPEVVCMQ
jgi:hypothetical protein